MARRVFYSFDFASDFWRTQQVRNIRALEGQRLATPNEWEEIQRKGDASIKRWIDENLYGKSCVVVLVGSDTANRRWVQYEIVSGWNQGKGVLGVRIHGLLDRTGSASAPGPNPFDRCRFDNGIKTLASVAPLKNPRGMGSRAIYASIAANLEHWIEEAIEIRKGR